METWLSPKDAPSTVAFLSNGSFSSTPHLLLGLGDGGIGVLFYCLLLLQTIFLFLPFLFHFEFMIIKHYYPLTLIHRV